MPREKHPGDFIKLPSGKNVRIMVPAVPERPWKAIEVGHVWHVCREHGLPAAGVSFYFGPRGPLQLDEADAMALAKGLNSVRDPSAV